MGVFAPYIHEDLYFNPKTGKASWEYFHKDGETSHVVIVSGYRPRSSGSFHASGKALDFRLDGVTFPAAEIVLEFMDPSEEGEGGWRAGYAASFGFRYARAIEAKPEEMIAMPSEMLAIGAAASKPTRPLIPMMVSPTCISLPMPYPPAID